MHEEELGVDILRAIALDISTLNLCDACLIVFVDYGRWQVSLDVEALPYENEESAQPNAFTTGFIQRNQFGLIR